MGGGILDEDWDEPIPFFKINLDRISSSSYFGLQISDLGILIQCLAFGFEFQNYYSAIRIPKSAFKSFAIWTAFLAAEPA
jgi:hypothetical protein